MLAGGEADAGDALKPRERSAGIYLILRSQDLNEERLFLDRQRPERRRLAGQRLVERPLAEKLQPFQGEVHVAVAESLLVATALGAARREAEEDQTVEVSAVAVAQAMAAAAPAAPFEIWFGTLLLMILPVVVAFTTSTHEAADIHMNGLTFSLGGFVVAYTIWYGLLRRHPMDRVVPFMLLMPVIGVAFSAAAFGERPAPQEAMWPRGNVPLRVDSKGPK